MQRIGRRARLKPGCEDAYDHRHQEVWLDVLAAIRRAGIANYTIFRRGQDLFSYFEVADLAVANAVLSADEACGRWQAEMAPLMEADDPLSPWQALEEVFHAV